MRRTIALLAAIACFTLGAVPEADAGAQAPATLREPTKPRDVTKLDPGTEETLRWGEPANGMRAALMIRTVADEPNAGDLPELYLVVQNVSQASIRFTDTAEAPKRREFWFKKDGRIQGIMTFKEPTQKDVSLQPRQVAFLRMFSPEIGTAVRQTVGEMVAETALKDKDQRLLVKLKIEDGPAGSWSGSLVTGETSGAEATGKPVPKAKKS